MGSHEAVGFKQGKLDQKVALPLHLWKFFTQNLERDANLTIALHEFKGALDGILMNMIPNFEEEEQCMWYTKVHVNCNY